MTTLWKLPDIRTEEAATCIKNLPSGWFYANNFIFINQFNPSDYHELSTIIMHSSWMRNCKRTLQNTYSLWEVHTQNFSQFSMYGVQIKNVSWTLGWLLKRNGENWECVSIPDTWVYEGFMPIPTASRWWIAWRHREWRPPVFLISLLCIRLEMRILNLS